MTDFICNLNYRMESFKLPPPLSPKVIRSFAHMSMTERIPVIFDNIKKTLRRRKDDVERVLGIRAGAEVDILEGRISKLLNEIVNNKPMLKLEDSGSDTETWNKYLDEKIKLNGGDDIRWHETTWLYLECYMYRRLQEAVELSPMLKHIDIFELDKKNSFMNFQDAICLHITKVHNILKEVNANSSEEAIKGFFLKLIQASLWGNKCDLSLTCGNKIATVKDPLAQLTKMESHILVNKSEEMWAQLIQNKRQGRSTRFDIIMDNAGFELITDMCLAEFMVSTGLVSVVHFHPKNIPWFVSDTTQEDWDWTLDMLGSTEESVIKLYGEKWKGYVEEGLWKLQYHDFWTSPFAFFEMEQRAPELYEDLKGSDMILFKGDLNYRKLVGDRHWEHTTPIKVSLQGFNPAPLCTFRTLKCDVVADLRPGLAEEIRSRDEHWLVNGVWAVMSYYASSTN